MSNPDPDPNEVDMTNMVRVTDDEFDPNAVDYHPEGSPVDEFATKPLTAPSVGASDNDDFEDDDTDPGLGDDDDEEDFVDPDLSLLDDFLSEDDDECLEDIDDGEAQVDDAGPLCLSDDYPDDAGDHCGPLALTDDRSFLVMTGYGKNVSEFLASIPLSADEPKPISEVVRTSGVRQSIEEFLDTMPLPADYVPGKFRSPPLSADEPKPISEVVRTSGVRQSFDDFLSSIPADYVPGKFFRVINDWRG